MSPTIRSRQRHPLKGPISPIRSRQDLFDPQRLILFGDFFSLGDKHAFYFLREGGRHAFYIIITKLQQRMPIG